MLAFPLEHLPMPPPVDTGVGKEILQANPWVKTEDQAETVRNIVAFMQQTIHYRLDEGETNYWVPPRLVLAQGSGDCEDGGITFMSIASAAGIPAGLAFYFDSNAKVGHTVAYVPMERCCADLSFFYIIDNSEGHGVRLWEAPSLEEAKTLFGYPEVEKVTEARLWPG